MTGSWRDPDDIKPDARHKPREIDGYRTFCPLRRMARQPRSQISARHIAAADHLRTSVDLAVIGAASSREQVLRVAYGPLTGPSAAAMRQSKAMREVMRALGRVPPAQRPLLTAIVLLNWTLAAWCIAAPRRNPQVEMGRLLSVLDLLEEHFRAEIDRDLALGHAPAA